MLTFVNIAEWPVLLSRGLNYWLHLTVPVRRALFVLMLADLSRRQRWSPIGLQLDEVQGGSG